MYSKCLDDNSLVPFLVRQEQFLVLSSYTSVVVKAFNTTLYQQGRNEVGSLIYCFPKSVCFFVTLHFHRCEKLPFCQARQYVLALYVHYYVCEI